MSKNHFAPIVALMLTLFTQSVSAFFDPPYITPGSPAVGDVISVNIRGGECDSITGVPGYPIFTRDGNAIRILFLGVHYDDPLLCTIPVGTATYPVGSFEAGSYTLQVDLHEPGEPASTLGTVPFTVMGIAEPPISAPTLTSFGVLVLLLGVIGLVARKFRASVTQVNRPGIRGGNWGQSRPSGRHASRVLDWRRGLSSRPRVTTTPCRAS